MVFSFIAKHPIRPSRIVFNSRLENLSVQVPSPPPLRIHIIMDMLGTASSSTQLRSAKDIGRDAGAMVGQRGRI